MKQHTILIRSALVTCLLALASATGAYAQTQITSSYSMPIQFQGTINELDCDNSNGPQVTIEGGVLIGGLNAKFILQNNLKGTHQTTVETDLIVGLVPLGTVYHSQTARPGRRRW